MPLVHLSAVWVRCFIRQKAYLSLQTLCHIQTAPNIGDGLLVASEERRKCSIIYGNIGLLSFEAGCSCLMLWLPQSWVTTALRHGDPLCFGTVVLPLLRAWSTTCPQGTESV